MTRRERERKIKMFGMIGMSILVIGSLATATYAWFVQRPATITTNTLTILAPDDYSYYGYNGNFDPEFEGPNGVFDHDFTHIDSSNKIAMTSFTGTYPGQSKIYCIRIASKTAGNDVTLKLNKLISNNADKEEGETYHRYIEGTTTDINIGNAIDITAMASSDGTGYYSDASSWLVVKNPSGELAGDVFTETNIPTSKLNEDVTTIKLDTPLTIFSADSDQKEWTGIYIFYRVYFSEATSTLYREINDKDGDNVPVTNANRTFVKDPENGTSNCYAGLTFQLVEMELEF